MLPVSGFASLNYFRDLERDCNFSMSPAMRASFLARTHRFICVSRFLASLNDL
jgi:hypothetical protein